MTMIHAVLATSLGRLLIATDGQALSGVWFEGQAHAPRMQDGLLQNDHPLLRQAANQIQAFLAGQPQPFEVPLSPSLGTPFQRQVWQEVASIARGQVRTYAEIAQALGRPQAARAVGAAVGRNPWLLVVPCHRVVGRGGALTGYAAGLARKQALLSMEGHLH
jgi:methylated-DNA-[protein]-cysteine S-methyltransferase